MCNISKKYDEKLKRFSVQSARRSYVLAIHMQVWYKNNPYIVFLPFVDRHLEFESKF